jgi:hypothetical protein
VLTGCGPAGEAARPAPHPRPASSAECNQLTDTEGDGTVLAGTDWSGEDHALGDPATVYACLMPSTGGTVQLVATGHGIDVSPANQRVGAFPTGVIPFQVTVARGGFGTLTVQQTSAGGYTGGPGPSVATGNGVWWLVRPQG